MRPPSGTPPPKTIEVGGLRVDLVALAEEICTRYQLEFTDEFGRYGAVAGEWCRHDNQWLLSWAVADLQEVTDLDEQARWLARVLHNRGFPVERLVRNLRIAAEVVRDGAIGDASAAVAGNLERAAGSVEEMRLAE